MIEIACRQRQFRHITWRPVFLESLHGVGVVHPRIIDNPHVAFDAPRRARARRQRGHMFAGRATNGAAESRPDMRMTNKHTATEADDMTKRSADPTRSALPETSAHAAHLLR